MKIEKQKFSFRDFAQMFVRTRNGAEAAVMLGAQADEAKKIEANYLANEKVRAEIRKLDRTDEQTLCYVKTGLSRLAFGAVNEAAALIFAEDLNRDDILKADLFNVSEIKKIKGGGVEIKFFDRQKAMEKLVELDPELKEVSDAEEFLNALCRSSEELNVEYDTLSEEAELPDDGSQK